MTLRWLTGLSIALLVAASPVTAQLLPSGILQSGQLAALNAVLDATPAQNPSITIGVQGTFSGTITIRCAADGANFSSLLATNVADGTTSSTITTTGNWSVPNPGCLTLEAKMTSYTSGTALVTMTRGFQNAKSGFLPNTTVAGKGTGTTTGPVSAVICASTTLTGTAADTNETDVFTCTIPANTLSADTKMLRMTVYGSFGNNGNNKTLKAYWNGTNLGSIGPTASTNSWRLELVVARSSSTNAKTKIFAVYGTTTTTGGNLAITSDFTTALIIKVTGTNGTANAHDIDSDFGLVEALN